MRKEENQEYPRVAEQRCLWCCFPVDRSDRRVEVPLEPFAGKWCTANCAISFFKVYRRELAGHDFVRVLQQCTGTPSDVEWGPAPEPQAFEWWTPGGRSRAEFLQECRIISMRPFPVHRDPVDSVRRSCGLRELFELNTPQRAAPAKRPRMVTGGGGAGATKPKHSASEKKD